jgi:hypothetical protein
LIFFLFSPGLTTPKPLSFTWNLRVELTGGVEL